jgi:H+/Cl- antiporter ClcA
MAVQKIVRAEAMNYLSAVRWFILAIIAGVLVGISTTIFLKALLFVVAFTGRIPHYFLAIPLAFLASLLIVNKFAPEAGGHGVEKVIDSVHKRFGKVDPEVVPVKIITTIITIGAGGSAGKEGPSVQIGAGVCSVLSEFIRLNSEDRKMLVICGISGGFAAVFGTPIAGAIFGIEVLYVGKMMYEALLPSFTAGIISYEVAVALGVPYANFALSGITFATPLFLETALAGLFFGLVALVFIELFGLVQRIFRDLRVDPVIKPIIGGIFLVAIGLFFSTQYLGLGTDAISAYVAGSHAAWYDFILKGITSSVTLNSGGSGGVITPLFFIGAASGSLFAQLLGLNLALFAAIGMVGVTAGATNTPIASSIMAIELFGPGIAVFAAIACIISFIVSGSRSIYPSQEFYVKRTIS